MDRFELENIAMEINEIASAAFILGEQLHQGDEIAYNASYAIGHHAERVSRALYDLIAKMIMAE